MQVSLLIYRLLLSFVVLMLLTRLMGRKEISQLTFFNFVSAIAIGTIGASLAIDPSLSIRNGIIALVAWTLFTIATGMLDMKSKTARSIVEGQPVTVIKNGKIMEEELYKARLDMNALRTLLRKKNVFSLSDVNYAIFETDGTLSVLKKEEQLPVTKNDLNIGKTAHTEYPIATALVSDGQVLDDNLRKLNLDRDWLNQQLKSAGGGSPENVFYAEIQKDGTLYIDRTDDSPKPKQLH
ncbi:DUF421 domain-containing protein [Neobacillus sp. PS3-34]|uniref:DUF421 domain-containing protein n=1 Tax=Neobacillus sp. PS3-34 TaxID=3070678 RepID=UPI0027DF0876|nr:DUF421 domain-containing protein [Neobacillus sp. PS3-34]WML50119.1 DUF421 domain-containing protein [Neobacillus sp. PS3-34]